MIPSLWRLRRSRIRPLRVTLSGPAAEIALDESGRKVIEVAQWASRRGRRTLIDREDLLWGLLADASSESVHILRRGNVDLGRALDRSAALASISMNRRRPRGGAAVADQAQRVLG